jgi:tyrosyl-tRNA synthetase
MQAVDIAHLKADVAIGGMDQRKVHMVARERLPTLGYPKPVCVHTPLLHGLDGAAKMSSSKGNFIAIDDSPQTIREKTMKAFCPPKQTENNPIIEYTEHIVLPEVGKLKIERPAKYGGELELEDVEKLKRMYRDGELHPTDLKMAVAEALVWILEPVRRYFDEHPDLRLKETKVL